MRRRSWSPIIILVALASSVILAQQGWKAWNALREQGACDELARAGVIRLTHLETDFPLDRLFPSGKRPENAAQHYAAALNAFEARRRAPRDRFAPLRREPAIIPAELHELVLGSRCRDCDFYARDKQGPTFSYRTGGGSRKPFLVMSDPFTARPYISSMRALSEAALREGKRREGTGARAQAETIYAAVLRMAHLLREKPGSFMDLQFGLEMEQNALHYLDVFYRINLNKRRRMLCWKYGDSVARLGLMVRRKYVQLGDFEAAREIALKDHDFVWRVEAIAALRTRCDDSLLDWWHARRALQVFEVLAQGPDPDVARAARDASLLPSRDDGPPERHLPMSSRPVQRLTRR